MVTNTKLRHEGICYSGQWEPIYFTKQSGHNNENIESRYAFELSEPYLAHLSSLGVNQLWTKFFKGYGLAFEDSEQQKLRGLVERCHKHGIRVFAYCTFGTLTLETLLAEEPGAADWVAKPDFFNHASYFGYQCFRARVDYTSEEWRAYLKRVVDKALDLGADGIHFDNAEMSIGFEACRCERCTRLFREYLAQRYGTRTAATRRAGLARYGTNRFAHVEPPWFTLGQHPVNQRKVTVPIQQDWVEFRCECFTGALRGLADHIRSRGRAVAPRRRGRHPQRAQPGAQRGQDDPHAGGFPPLGRDGASLYVPGQASVPCAVHRQGRKRTGRLHSRAGTRGGSRDGAERLAGRAGSSQCAP